MASNRIHLLVLLLFIILILSLTAHYIIINHVYTKERIWLSFGDTMNMDQINLVVSNQSNTFFLTFVVSVTTFMVIIILSSFSIYSALILRSKNVQFIDVLIISGFLQLILFIPQFYSLFYYLKIIKIFIIPDFERFYPLSLAAIISDTGAKYSFSILKHVNLFQLVYVIGVARVLNYKYCIPISEGLKCVALGYGIFFSLYLAFGTFMNVIL